MRVFISSVRRGLEAERDALPGLIAAVGHEPSRFEDFTAQTVPSREACLRGVQEADVYVLVVGPHYGHPFPDTGQSPTHDEWIAATAAGIPRLVYVKRGVAFDEAQRAFLDHVESYEHGVFRDSFEEPTELLTKVARKLREIASAPGPLVFAPLSTPIAVEWLTRGEPWAPSVAGVLEVHAVPTAATPLSGRQLLSIAESMPTRLRTSPLVGQSRALALSRDAAGVSIELPQESHRGAGGRARPAELLGARVSAASQVSSWAALPGDGMGSVVEPAAIGTLIAGLLRLIGLTGACERGPVAIGVGIYEPMMVSVDSLPAGGRVTATFGMRDEHLHVEPDEVVSLSALHEGAIEMGQHLGVVLIDRLQHRYS